MNDVLTFVSQNLDEGKKVALVTVTGITGSSPATPGQMLAVLTDGTTKGTAGGGASEHLIIERAKLAIQNNENTFTLKIDHSESGMSCGGSMEVFGNILGNHTGLCIFGGGHIAQSLAKIASQTGFYVTVIEDRPEFEENFDSASYITSKPEDYGQIGAINFADFVVICTRGHSTDDIALRYCLSKKIKYIGMIGSKTKVAEIFSKLRSEGVPQADLDSVFAPIGLDIASSDPREIAVAILAELLLIKNNGKLQHKRKT
ncbi:MAG: XdhC/CoxI family protein [Oscillospiraceae bacterium]|nr:XdhC/CoxI family protein [Oscillospiraceae bacterium]